ncbi:MAG: YlxR family protein [Chloroflexi bacterium]|nr:YlxR family protein [Chloroflexota bacterium]MCY3937777.1 YlxR family protein [Chloroflexota bacterium]
MRKHIPQRSCIVCRLKVAKDELLRIVRCPDGTLSLDLSGRLPGRGAYVCDSVKCWETAVDRGAIQRALNVRLEVGAMDKLRSEFRDIALRMGVS